jgi:hypothetical protein
MYVVIPTFKFENNTVSIVGKCILEDAGVVWKPFIVLLEDHINVYKNSIINFRLEGFNSSSIMYLSKIFNRMNELSFKKKIEVNWYYLEIDEDMQFYGEEYKELSKNLIVNLIPVQGQILNPSV